MTRTNDSMLNLVATAEQAYRRARAEVFDKLAAGARVDFDALSPSQRDAFEDLVIAEAELANGRSLRYGGPAGQ
jgi:hypothetical protein